MWRYRGSPYYLAQQAKRLGITQGYADQCRHNPEVFRISTLLSLLCEQWHRARKVLGVPVFDASHAAQNRSTLERCEVEVAKLHMLAASADAMLAEAWRAFGSEPPRRPYVVACDHDNAPTPTP